MEIDQGTWEKAFFAYALDAATGRLFRGLTHNLNGVAQVFSMQTELFQMLFGQMDELLGQLGDSPSPEAVAAVSGKLRAMLQRRAELLVHLQKEVKLMQEIMQRTAMTLEAAGSQKYALSAVVGGEIEFMNGDGFFKHKVEKAVELADNLPQFTGYFLEMHQILLALLENASQAMQIGLAPGQNTPLLRLSAVLADNNVVVSVSDNAAGVDAPNQEKIFEPFFTTRPGRLGLGLFLARRLAARFRGVLALQPASLGTTFILTVPLDGGAFGGQ